MRRERSLAGEDRDSGTHHVHHREEDWIAEPIDGEEILVQQDDADIAEVPRRDHAEGVHRSHLLERAPFLLTEGTFRPATPVEPCG